MRSQPDKFSEANALIASDKQRRHEVVPAAHGMLSAFSATRGYLAATLPPVKSSSWLYQHASILCSVNAGK
jgi:hypothetical protein